MDAVKRRYVSSRSGTKRYTFREAVLAGWAEDGGMILPEELSLISSETLESWRVLTYPELVHQLLRHFLQDEDFPALKDIIDRSFQTFASPQVVEFKPLKAPSSSSSSSSSWNSTSPSPPIYLAELFHGPSLAFKDLGMQVLANLLEHYLEESQTSMTFLVGTSGDTGPSALEAVKGKARMRLLVLYPLGRISPTQEAQMLAAHATGENVCVVAVDGTSDDLDEPITEIFQDEAARQKHHLGSLNSVNIVRLLVQVFHYFYAYLQLTRPPTSSSSSSGLPRISFAVPTGAAGHITAGIIAALMGLPIDQLLMATNDNDILVDMMKTGKLRKKHQVIPTLSPAMDIQAPYNIERILHLLTHNYHLPYHHQQPTAGKEEGGIACSPPASSSLDIAAMMDTFYQGQDMLIPPLVLQRLQDLGLSSLSITATIDAGSARKEDGPYRAASVVETICKVYEEEDYILDPHTAIGVSAATAFLTSTLASTTIATKTAGIAVDVDAEDKEKTKETKGSSIMVCMGCAHPAKFASTISQALGKTEAETIQLIAERSYTPVIDTLNLVSLLAQQRIGSGDRSLCPHFAQNDRSRWRLLLEEEIKRLETANST